MAETTDVRERSGVVEATLVLADGADLAAI
jgi:hypothetical protein